MRPDVKMITVPKLTLDDVKKIMDATEAQA
jgi:hypothetical protein